MSTTASIEGKVMSSVRTASTERGTLMVAQLFTALLLVSVGIWLVVLFQKGFNGGGTLVGLGAVELVLGLVSLAAVPGLRAGRRPGWIRPLSIAGAVFNAAAIALAAAATLIVTYPGGAVVLLILFNDVIIGELVVLYLLTRPTD